MVTTFRMDPAYQRELRLMPYILRMEQRGINLDGPRLQKDTDAYWTKLDELDEAICTIVGREVDVDSGAQLADAIERKFPNTAFATTPTGLRSTAKESLINAITDPALLGHLLVRGSIATCLRTFMQPWLVQYEKHGRLYMKWNQIRNYSDTGARTGRISSSPNLQNVPVEWEGLKKQLERISYPIDPETLPQVRKYLIPDPGMIFVGRDYSGQELRLLAHFTQGKLLEALKTDPFADLHQIAAQLAGISRREAKTLAFAILYGAGVGRISESLEMTVSEATRVKNGYLAALPEIKQFTKQVQDGGRAKVAIKTIGGREYYTQKPSVIKGVFKTFEYKLVNYLIQGSAADQTKQAMINFADATSTGELVLSVHDQLVIQCPLDNIDNEAKNLECAMNSAFQETLRYQVISEEDRGYNFSEL